MSDEKNPWERKSDGPPDLLKLLKNFFGKSTGGDGSGGGAFEMASFWVWIVVAFVVVIYLLSGIYIVNQAQQAVVLRFGKYVATVDAGPHWLPPFIESERKVDIQQIRNFQYPADMLTMDENIVSISFAVQYRVDNPRAYLFNVVNPSATLRQATASALRQVVGHMKLDPILTTGRGALRDQVAKQLESTVASYKMGISIVDVRLLQTKPPEQVTEAFDDAIKAREDEQSSINKGEAYARKVTSEVKGNIAKLTQSAEAYKQEVVLQAQGNVARYQAVLKPYLASPVVTRERLYLDTVQDVLSHTNNVIVDSGAHNVLYLPLDQMIRSHMAAKLPRLPLVSPASPPANAGAATPAQVPEPDANYGKPRPSYSMGIRATGGFQS